MGEGGSAIAVDPCGETRSGRGVRVSRGATPGEDSNSESTVSPMRPSATCQDAHDVDGMLNVGGGLIIPLNFGSIDRAPLHGAPSETPQIPRGGPAPLKLPRGGPAPLKLARGGPAPLKLARGGPAPLRCMVEDNSARGGIGSTSPDGSGSREPQPRWHTDPGVRTADTTNGTPAQRLQSNDGPETQEHFNR